MFVRGTLFLAAVVALAAVISGPLMEPHMRARILRIRLQAYYSAHAPAQLEKLDTLVEKYVGNEAALLQKLEEKYSVPVPEVDVWQLHDPIGVGAFMAYTEGKKLALELASRLEAHFPRIRDAVDAKLTALGEQTLALRQFASAPAQLLLFALAYVLLASRMRGFARCLALVLVSTMLVLVVRPSVDDLSPASLQAGAEELSQLTTSKWAGLATLGKLAVTTLAALLSAFTCARHHKSFALFAWALTVLALTNPALPPGATLQAVQRLGVADAASVSLFRHTDENLFAVRDLTFCTVLTLSPVAAAGNKIPEWSSPMLSVGLGERWFVLSRVEASKTDETRVRIDLSGMALPIYFAPLSFGALLLVAASLSGFF